MFLQTEHGFRTWVLNMGTEFSECGHRAWVQSMASGHGFTDDGRQTTGYGIRASGNSSGHGSEHASECGYRAWVAARNL